MKYIINIFSRFCSANSLIDSAIYIADQIVKKTNNKIDDFLVNNIKTGIQMQKEGASLKDIGIKLLVISIKKLVDLTDNELDQHDADQIMEILKKKGLIK